MFTKLFLFFKNFPRWYKSLKTNNSYLYYGIGLIFLAFLLTVVNFFTFQSKAFYATVMMIIPVVWTLGHILWLGVKMRKDTFEKLSDVDATVLLPHTYGMIIETISSLMIIYQVSRFDGTENDYLYTLIFVFIIKILISILTPKIQFRKSVYLKMVFLIISLLLTLTIFSLAVTV